MRKPSAGRAGRPSPEKHPKKPPLPRSPALSPVGWTKTRGPIPACLKSHGIDRVGLATSREPRVQAGGSWRQGRQDGAGLSGLPLLLVASLSGLPRTPSNPYSPLRAPCIPPVYPLLVWIGDRGFQGGKPNSQRFDGFAAWGPWVNLTGPVMGSNVLTSTTTIKSLGFRWLIAGSQGGAEGVLWSVNRFLCVGVIGGWSMGLSR